MKLLSEIQELVKSNPNDQDLGSEIRKLYNKVETESSRFIICIKCGIWQSIFNHKCKHCGHEIQNR